MYKFAIKNLQLGMTVSLFALLAACSKSSDRSVYTVAPQKISHILSFKSTIAPREIINVQSPADATVQQVYFSPGSLVEKNKPLVTLYSPKFINDYQTAMLSYLKAKEDYANAQSSFIGTENLWGHGLISKDEYTSQKTLLANNYATFLEQQSALQKFLPPNATIDQSLSLENKKDIQTLFNNQSNLVNIYSPADGVALSAAKAESPNESNASSSSLKLAPGSNVHQGDSLLTIGDLSGFNLIVSVSEMDINKIQTGMPATVTSDAFPEVLTGVVEEVGIEAKSAQSDVTLPEFPVRVYLPNIPKAYLKDVRLGMTAKVNIETGSSQQILVPLDAVGTQNGQSIVQKITGYHQTKNVIVSTGDTTIDQVTILSGLHAGDKILVPYQA